MFRFHAILVNDLKKNLNNYIEDLFKDSNNLVRNYSIYNIFLT